VRIASVSCVPTAKCSGNPHQVSTRGTLLLKGNGLRRRGWSSPSHEPPARASPAHRRIAHLRIRPSAGLIVTVPKQRALRAHHGAAQPRSLHELLRADLRRAHALHPPRAADPARPQRGAVEPTAFEGQGMWIWYLSKSDGGDVASIIAQAHAADVSTLFIKSSDGPTNYWSQFSPQLVAELHANG
jgi:hypothetical protein